MLQLPSAFLMLVFGGGEFTIVRTAKPPIVIRATGQVAKEVTIGKPLPQQSAFGLKAGDILSLLDAKGVRILKGPGFFKDGKFLHTGSSASEGVGIMATTDASEAATEAQAYRPPKERGFSLTKPEASSATRQKSTSIAVPAKTASVASRSRQLGGPWHAKDLRDTDWLFDGEDSTLICLPDGARPVFFRDAATDERTVVVQSPEERASFTWLKDQHVAPWPLKLSAAQSYAVATDGAQPRIVQIIGLMADEPSADRPLGVRQPCMSQVELNAKGREEQALLEALVRGAVEPD